MNDERKVDDTKNDTEINLKDYPPLTPHKYPRWIICFGGLTLLMLLYSFFLLPQYFVAAKNLNLGEWAYRKKDYPKAIHFLNNVLSTVPSSKAAKLFLAKSYFSTQKPENYELGLMCLQGIKLEKRAWKEIKTLMPKEYESLFTTERA